MTLEAQHTMLLEPVRTMQGDGFDWAHEIRVALPPSYHATNKQYPVLWVVDGSALFDLAAGVLQFLVGSEAPELIIVGVGCPRDVSTMEYQRRRTFEFGPNEELFYEGLGADVLRRQVEAAGFDLPPSGGAGMFLDFLVDDVRSALSAEFRMEPNGHALVGHSGGGMFVGFAMFARPDAFAKYICGSPSLNGGNQEIFDLEQSYSAGHDDLNAQVFLGAGETEIDDPGAAAWSIVGSMIRLAETLRLRSYPSLQLHSRVFPGETHLSVAPLILSWGLRTLWTDDGEGTSS